MAIFHGDVKSVLISAFGHYLEKARHTAAETGTVLAIKVHLFWDRRRAILGEIAFAGKSDCHAFSQGGLNQISKLSNQARALAI